MTKPIVTRGDLVRPPGIEEDCEVIEDGAHREAMPDGSEGGWLTSVRHPDGTIWLHREADLEMKAAYITPRHVWNGTGKRPTSISTSPRV